MTMTPKSYESLPLMRLRTLVSNSAEFRTWTGTATPAEALARILYGTTRNLSLTHPVAFVKFGDAFNLESNGSGTVNNFMGGDSGAVNLVLEADCNQGFESEADNLMEFMNHAGQIIDEMAAIANGEDDAGNPYLNATSFSRVDGPKKVGLSENSTKTDFFQVEYAVRWNG